MESDRPVDHDSPGDISRADLEQQMDAQYSLDRDGQRYGPYTLDEIKTYLAQGSVAATDMVWTAGMPSWIPVSQLLGTPMAAPPPPLAPPRLSPGPRELREPLTPAHGAKKKGGTPVIVIVLAVVFGVFVIGAIISAIAVPGLLRARQSGNEASAIASLRAINSAQAAFSSRCGGFAPNLESLNEQGLLSPDLAGASVVEKSGYRITIEAGADAIAEPPVSTDCTGITGFVAYADPITPGSTGSRHFATDTRMTIYQDVSTMSGSGGIPPSATPIY